MDLREFIEELGLLVRSRLIVLWIDDLEQAFASIGHQDGARQRVLGGFVSWPQECRGDVFVVATWNDVTTLPPRVHPEGSPRRGVLRGHA